MLQLPDVGKSGQVQGCTFPPIGSRVYGEYPKRSRINGVSDPWQIQTGDPAGTGAGGESYWGTPFRDEHDLKGAAKHDKRGVISMANKGANTNGLAPCLSAIRFLN
jgi:hypothetical protein